MNPRGGGNWLSSWNFHLLSSTLNEPDRPGEPRALPFIRVYELASIVDLEGSWEIRLDPVGDIGEEGEGGASAAE